jgi:hypothetical protein
LSQLFFDEGSNGFEGLRRDLVLKLCQFLNVFRRENVRSNTHELSEFDKTGPQLRQHSTQPPRRRKNRGRAFRAAFLRRRRSFDQRIGQRSETVFHQHTRNADEAADPIHADEMVVVSHVIRLFRHQPTLGHFMDISLSFVGSGT